MNTSDLTAAQHELNNAVADLIHPIHGRILRDDSTATEHTAPSLIQQLRNATGNGGARRGNGHGSNGLPVDPAAVDLLNEIELSTRDLHDRAVEHSKPTIEQLVARIELLAIPWTDINAIHWVTSHLRMWQRAILTLLDPPRRAHIAAPCPACNQRMVLRPDTDGHTVQVPALAVDPHAGCTCLACGTHWPPQQFEHLARVLGCQPLPQAG